MTNEERGTLPQPSFPRRRESRRAAVSISSPAVAIMDSRLRGNDGVRVCRRTINAGPAAAEKERSLPHSSSRRTSGSMDAVGYRRRTTISRAGPWIPASAGMTGGEGARSVPPPIVIPAEAGI
ncbi:hypothetical protein WR25_20066 [Diploscapter pachys]|uniref:Uncharacterized protein n=1 Tax=Diploscapter pachys TaxID=2018661 RepID=A0A2A2KE07_9BILA|nr:hypothetical protein WR25_20066 [Diploscapter pachys]